MASHRTYAATRKSQPTSTAFAISELFANLSLLAVGAVDNYKKDSNAYNLQELCDLESVVYGDIDSSSIDLNSTKVEKIGMDYVSTIVDGIDSKISFECDKEAASFMTLPMSVYSSRQRPDVVILYNDFIILLFEIDSCSGTVEFQNTIRKTILGLIDTIRWYRLHGMCSVNQWTGFTFPKFKKKECVVKVTVKFDPYLFKFVYQLKFIAKDSVRYEVRSTLCENLSNHRKIRDINVVHSPNWYIRLSDSELKIFKDLLKLKNVQQLESKQSILIKGDDYCYKFPVRLADCEGMIIVCFALRGTSGFAIEPYQVPDPNYDGCFQYKFIQRGCLSPSEVKPCLGDFVSRMIKAIDALHSCCLAHLDIRLDNICFDEDYNPILIDLDRARSTKMWSSAYVYPCSVMYVSNNEFKGKEHDWLQLACIILWVLTEELQLSSYHCQSFTVDHDIIKDKFFITLKRGKCDSSAFIKFRDRFGGTQTIEDVFRARSSASTNFSAAADQSSASTSFSAATKRKRLSASSLSSPKKPRN